MNTTEAITLTRIVRAAFPAQKFDEFTIDVWADALRDEDFGECRGAVRRLVSRQTFASVADVIAEAKAHRRDALRQLKDRETFRAIEAAKDYDAAAAEEARREARRAFDAAIAARRAREGREEAS